MTMEVLKLWLTLESYLNKKDAEKVRGYLGNIFWYNPIAHNHDVNNKFIYKYPSIQYKIVNGKCLLIGFNEGIEIIKETFNNLETINIDGSWEEVVGKGLEYSKELFMLTYEKINYTFLTPWLALNEKNYEKYVMVGSWEKRKKLLESILIGNIISISKSLGYTVSEPINVEIQKMREVKTKLKGTSMLGFLGTFSVNFEIPDYWGIGKSVSRGFGTIKKLEE